MMKGEGREEKKTRGASVGSAGGVSVQAPVAAREPVEHVIHGDRRVDHYAWMRKKEDPRVKEYLEAENAYADAVMRATEGFQEKLYQEMLGRIQQTDLSVPYSLRGYSYYTRTEEGKQYPIYCRRKETGDQQPATGKQGADIAASREEDPITGIRYEEERSFRPEGLRDQLVMTERESGRQDAGATKSGAQAGVPVPQGGEEEVLLELNELAVGHTFMGLGIFEVSDDNQRLAYATDTTGFRQYVLEVKELGGGVASGERPEAGEEVAGGEWRVASEGQEQSPQGLKPSVDEASMSDASTSSGQALKVRPPREGGIGSKFRAERVTSAAWAADNRTLFYVTEDEVTKRSNQLWRHEFSSQLSVDSSQFEKRGKGTGAGLPDRQGVETGKAGAGLPHSKGAELNGEERNPQGLKPDLGEASMSDLKVRPPEEDELIYEEKDERFRMDVERSRSGAYLFLVINSHTTSEARYLRSDTPRGAFQLVAEREDEHEYYLDHHPGSARDAAGGIFFIRTNSGGRTYRLMTAPTANPARSRWQEVIPNRPGVMLSGMEAFRTHLVLSEREEGLPYLRVVDLTREAESALAGSQRIEFAEPTYSAMLGANPEFDTRYVRFHYESLVTPRSVYDYDLGTGARILKKQQPVLGDFDSARYVSERLHAKAKDGTLVPISVVRRKDTYRDGNAPLLLYGYGSYGFSLPVTFSSNRLSLLDRGMVYAIAHVRGGGELGKLWHDAGRMHQKMNTFTDFIACAEFLIGKRYTSEGRLVIEGGSAGGLLMGAVTNMRPDLFRVVVSHVPFVDVLNTMLDPTLPLTVGEYEEWGNPQVEEDYFYIKQYCPYTNVERKVYPRMLVKTAWNDSQVMYWEAAKYVAKLRAMKTDGNVLLLKTNMGAGHGGASGRYDYLREIALDCAFLLGELGIRE